MPKYWHLLPYITYAIAVLSIAFIIYDFFIEKIDFNIKTVETIKYFNDFIYGYTISTILNSIKIIGNIESLHDDSKFEHFDGFGLGTDVTYKIEGSHSWSHILPEETRSSQQPQPEKRIALFSGAYNHIADGVTLTLNRLVDYLEKQGVAVRVFAPTVDSPPINHAGTLIPVPSLPLPGRSEYRLSLGLNPSAQRELEKFDPTLYHIATPDLLGRHALSRAQATNTPIVASYHTHFSSYLKYYHLDFLEATVWSYLRSFYSQCEQVYIPTVAIAEILRSHGITEGLRIWRRGVDTNRFSPTRRSNTWRQAHDIGDEVVVTFVSRLVWEKGLDVYAEVIERLERQNVPHHSLIVGDGPAREHLETRLSNTTFTGFLEGDTLARVYASSDLFLFPSTTETFGNVTLEAMASGLPTICADAAGSRDLVKDGTTGRLCPPGDVETFTEAVRTLIIDFERRNRMSEAAYMRAQDFSWETVLGWMNEYYDEALSSTVGEPRTIQDYIDIKQKYEDSPESVGIYGEQ